MPEDPNTVDWISRGIALASLGISGLSLVVSWRVLARDKGLFRVTCDYLPKTGLGAAFLVTVTNIGRRLITIDDIVIIENSGTRFSYRQMARRSSMFPHDLPLTLEETEKRDLHIPIWYLRNASRDPRSFKSIEVIDTRGKRRSIRLLPLVRGIADDPMFLPKKDRSHSEPSGSSAA